VGKRSTTVVIGDQDKSLPCDGTQCDASRSSWAGSKGVRRWCAMS